MPIDTWDIGSFDAALLSALREHEEAIIDYLITDRRQHLEREASPLRGPHAVNPHAGVYHWLTEHVVMPMMEARTIRAWHYTRLTNDEIEIVRSEGIYPSTLETIRRRLDAQVQTGVLSAKTAEQLFVASPFHSDSYGARSTKFWMTSDPLSPDHGGVEPLLGHWGGESIYFSLQDKSLQTLIARIGKPRVIEIAVPLSATKHCYSAAKAVVAAFAKSTGLEPDDGAFDLYATQRLASDAVLNIHTEGEPSFTALARQRRSPPGVEEGPV